MYRVTFFCSLAMLILAPIGRTWQKSSAATALFTATAYCNTGPTVKGNSTHAGTAAADPSVIPLGSKVRVTEAGPYSGDYAVTDTGRKVNGHAIDLYIADPVAAKQFGRKQVRVQILVPGDNVKNLPETSAKVPKSQLAPAEKAPSAPPR
jgi:3D (Asp-Asp-Asp) domain-containing protein